MQNLPVKVSKGSDILEIQNKLVNGLDGPMSGGLKLQCVAIATFLVCMHCVLDLILHVLLNFLETIVTQSCKAVII